MSITLYGIKNCDTMKKAGAWLEDHGIPYAFHDYRSAGIERVRLERWCEKAGWERLLNRAGTTFRKLPEEAKTGLDRAAALRLMLAEPTMIKRPVLESGERVIVGFDPAVYATLAPTGPRGRPSPRA